MILSNFPAGGGTGGLKFASGTGTSSYSSQTNTLTVTGLDFRPIAIGTYGTKTITGGYYLGNTYYSTTAKYSSNSWAFVDSDGNKLAGRSQFEPLSTASPADSVDTNTITTTDGGFTTTYKTSSALATSENVTWYAIGY